MMSSGKKRGKMSDEILEKHLLVKIGNVSRAVEHALNVPGQLVLFTVSVQYTVWREVTQK